MRRGRVETHAASGRKPHNRPSFRRAKDRASGSRQGILEKPGRQFDDPACMHRDSCGRRMSRISACASWKTGGVDERDIGQLARKHGMRGCEYQ